MRDVVGADAHGVEVLRLGVEHGLVVGIQTDALNAVALEELLRLAGDQVGGGDDLDVGHLLVALNVSFGNPAGADDADLQLAGDVNLLFLGGRGKLVENSIRHGTIPLFSIYDGESYDGERRLLTAEFSDMRC